MRRRRRAALLALAVLIFATGGLTGHVSADDRGVVTATLVPNPLAASLHLSADQVEAGKRLRATAEIENLGDQRLSNVELSLRVDPEGVSVKQGDTRLVRRLRGEGSRRVSWSVCALEPGNYLLMVVATVTDAEDKVFTSESGAELLQVLPGDGAKCR